MKPMTLAIEAHNTPAMMERVLRVTRHRGFKVCDMNMRTYNGQDNVTISLTVTGERPLELLTNQLNKLVDVASLEVLSAQQLKLNA